MSGNLIDILFVTGRPLALLPFVAITVPFAWRFHSIYAVLRLSRQGGVSTSASPRYHPSPSLSSNPGTAKKAKGVTMIGLASMHDQGWSRRPTPETPKPQQSFIYWTGPILLSRLSRVAVDPNPSPQRCRYSSERLRLSSSGKSTQRNISESSSTSALTRSNPAHSTASCRFPYGRDAVGLAVRGNRRHHGPSRLKSLVSRLSPI